MREARCGQQGGAGRPDAHTKRGARSSGSVWSRLEALTTHASPPPGLFLFSSRQIRNQAFLDSLAQLGGPEETASPSKAKGKGKAKGKARAGGGGVVAVSGAAQGSAEYAEELAEYVKKYTAVSGA